MLCVLKLFGVYVCLQEKTMINEISLIVQLSLLDSNKGKWKANSSLLYFSSKPYLTVYSLEIQQRPENDLKHFLRLFGCAVVHDVSSWTSPTLFISCIWTRGFILKLAEYGMCLFLSAFFITEVTKIKCSCISAAQDKMNNKRELKTDEQMQINKPRSIGQDKPRPVWFLTKWKNKMEDKATVRDFHHLYKNHSQFTNIEKWARKSSKRTFELILWTC